MESIYTTTKQFLIDRPLPIETRTYKPVSHESLIDLTLEGIHHAGFSLQREIYSSAHNGNIAFGRYLIGNVSDNEMQLQIMWQNSYDKSKKATFAIGAMVLVCTNGMMAFRSAGHFERKHMSDIQTFTPEAIPEYINSGTEVFATLQQDRDKMKQIELSRKTTAEIIGRMYIEEEFLESTQLNIIKRELKKPTFDYGASHSLWELYQFTTFAIGGIHPSRWMEDHIDAHKFFVQEAELILG